MDKKKSILNVAVSLIFKLAIVFMSILVRRTLIRSCGNDVNGLNSLYLSIIGFLEIAELGVGTAITFCMYRPIVEGDTQKVGALYHLFRRVHLVIASVILLAGLAITPFIHYLAKDYGQVGTNLYSTFALMLLSIVVTYFFSAELSLFNAHKNNYITTVITSGGVLLQHGLQIAVLNITGSYHGHLVCRIVAALVQWVITHMVVKKQYGHILKAKSRIDKETKHELTVNIRAMFMHKIGKRLVNTVDSVVIAAFIGVVELGNYTNYTVIQSSMDSLIILIFTSLTSVFGHLYVEKNKETVLQYCELFHVLNFMVGTVFYLGFYAVADSLVAMFFSLDLVAEKTISRIISMNGFVQFMRNSTISFRDATGTFYYDRWKSILEGTVNIILSVLLVKRIGVVGVIAATIFTNLLICHVVEPYVLYKYALSVSPAKYYMRNYSMIVLFWIGIVGFDYLVKPMEPGMEAFLRNGFASVGISMVLCMVVLLADYRLCRRLLRKIMKRK